MNSLIIYPEELDGAVATLRKTRATYAIEVHGARVGRDLTTSLLGAKIGVSTVIKCDLDQVVLDCQFTLAPPARLPIEIILAVPRPLTLKKILHVAASLGLYKLTLVESENVVKSYLQSPLLEPKNLEFEMIKGLEQVKDSVLPIVEIKESLMVCLLSADSASSKLLLHTSASPSINTLSQQYFPNGIVAAIGPESGWSEREINYFTNSGFLQVSLGPRMLRVEHAFTVALAQIQMLVN